MNSFELFIAKFLSVVLHPIFVPTYSCLLYQALFKVYPTNFGLILGIYFLITAVVPIAFIAVLYRLKLVSSFRIENANERRLPYLLALVAYVALTALLDALNQPVLLIVYTGSVCLAVLMCMNVVSKVSAHMTAIGGVTATIMFETFCLGMNPYGLFMTLFALSGLLAFARLRLKAHTAGQVSVGFLIGFLVIFLIIIFL